MIARSALINLARGVVFTSEDEEWSTFCFINPYFRETPAPWEMARRFCYELDTGSDACYIREGFTDSTGPTATPNRNSTNSRSAIFEPSKERQLTDWWAK